LPRLSSYRLPVAGYCIDDMVVQESVIGIEGLQRYMVKYRLKIKEPEGLDGG